MTLPSSDQAEAVRFPGIALRNGLQLTPEQLAVLARFVTLLKGWNAKVNLISRKDEENIWFSHILHSLSPLFYIDLPAGCQVLDLGTGGGLPGIPLAVARPGVHFTLLDSIQKKIVALQSILAELPLGNVQTLTGRAEQLSTVGSGGHRFDIVISRAVAPMSDLLKWSRDLLNRKAPRQVPVRPPLAGLKTPLIIALKGGDLEAELRLAETKFHPSAIHVLPLTFEGGGDTGLVDKKLVIVRP